MLRVVVPLDLVHNRSISIRRLCLGDCPSNSLHNIVDDLQATACSNWNTNGSTYLVELQAATYFEDLSFKGNGSQKKHRFLSSFGHAVMMLGEVFRQTVMSNCHSKL